MDTDRALRDHLLELLSGGSAHVKFEAAIEGLTPELVGKKAPGLPHTPWQLLEHLRIAQWDLRDLPQGDREPRPRRRGQCDHRSDPASA